MVNGTLLTNTVRITDTAGLSDTDEVTTTVQSSHALTVAKSASPNPAVAGELLTYTIAYTVGGNEPAFSLTISDVVPTDTVYQGCAGGLSCGVAGRVVTWSLGTVNPPTSGFVTLTVQVEPSLPTGVLLTNAVRITDTAGLSDTDEVTTTVHTRADLAVIKRDSPDPLAVGTLLTYTLLITNNGPSIARNAVVTDTLPPEVSLVNAIPAPSGTVPLTWSLGTMPVGASRLITVVVQVHTWATQTFTNIVHVGSDTPDDNPANDTDEQETTPLYPGLELTKTVIPGEVVRGMRFTYTLRIVNTGQLTLSLTTLTDTVPADFHYVHGSGSPVEPQLADDTTLIWRNLGSLIPGDVLTVTFAVTATPGMTGTYVNVATVEGEHPGGTITDTDDAPVSLQDPAVVVDKQLIAVDRDALQPNFVTFTIVITNVGVSIIDALPLLDVYDPYYLSFVQATPHPDQDADDGVLTWFDLTTPSPHGLGHNLAPGNSFRITTVFRIVHDITTTVNTAIISDVRDVYDNPANDDEDDETVEGVPTAVRLLYFRASARPGSVLLEWETAAEIDNYGFYLLRSDSGELANAIEVAFVPATGHGGGATYSFADQTVKEGTLYTYWLVDVDIAGQRTVHRSISVHTWGGLENAYHVYLPIVMK